MGPRAAHGEPARGLAAPGGRGDDLFAGQVLPGDGLFVGHDLRGGAGGDDLAAVKPRAGAHVHDVVRVQHGLGVVLHHDQRVAQVPEALQTVQEPPVVPLVQADGRLVQDVQHAHQSGADLGGQPDALRLAAGERARRAGEGQVAQPHVVQKAQPRVDLLEDLRGDHGLLLGEGQALEELPGVPHGQVGDL